jgi:hypothetical protein
VNRENIIRLALDAGFDVNDYGEWVGDKQSKCLERFAALVAEAEREACADICDQHSTCEGIAQKCAAAIRARGESK